MQIDWFTFGAQIVNFLVLVWLLKRFLYGPIRAAMAEREQRIADRFEEARQKQATAEAAAESYRRQTEALERARTERLAAAEREARERRQAMIDEARTEVDRLEAQWTEMLLRERAAFLADLSRRVERETLDLARRALRDLADADLERQVTRAFAERLRTLPGDARAALEAAVQAADEDVVLRTAFALSPPEQERLVAALRTALDRTVVPSFQQAPDLGVGIELRAGGHKVAWSLGSYFEEMERRIRARIDAELPPDVGPASAGDAAPSAAPAPSPRNPERA
jgi:F-type H+-transporting ATPase subunit b